MRISDKTQMLMFERWRDSIPPQYRAGRRRPEHWHGVTGGGAIITPMTGDATGFWTEFVSARDWTE
jgi:hypothetical protein